MGRACVAFSGFGFGVNCENCMKPLCKEEGNAVSTSIGGRANQIRGTQEAHKPGILCASPLG